MINKCLRRCSSLGLSFALMIFTTGISAGGQGSSGGTGDSAPQTPEQLQGLVAPIALYPDSLVAQVLGASTFPDQVAVANYWLQQHKDLTGSALMQAVNEQSWNASVKALTQFPSVLSNMANNLSWTSSLGEAYHNQQSDVMAAIQTLRHQAQAAGKLKAGSQIKVVQQSPQTIVIEPANPQVVFVPQYDPGTIYGYPYVTPGYTAGDVAAAGIIGFGAGIALGAFASGGCCGWGWGTWGVTGAAEPSYTTTITFMVMQRGTADITTAATTLTVTTAVDTTATTMVITEMSETTTVIATSTTSAETPST